MNPPVEPWPFAGMVGDNEQNSADENVTAMKNLPHVTLISGADQYLSIFSIADGDATACNGIRSFRHPRLTAKVPKNLSPTNCKSRKPDISRFLAFDPSVTLITECPPGIIVVMGSDARLKVLPIFWGFPMRAAGALALLVWSICLFSEPALAGKRVALVIGNSAYQNVIPLANPKNDSEAMSAVLKRAGFDVVELKHDLSVSEMRRALRDFSDTVRDADFAVVYFAGHGIEIDGTNYLDPG